MLATAQEQNIHVPQSISAILRPRLLAKLERGVVKRLTLVSAPPGYGKTTIVSQLANQISIPVVWHSVQERERDFSNLYHHALSTFEHLDRNLSSNLPPVENIPPSELATLIGDAIYEASLSDFIYVLDDVYHIDGSTGCEAWLRTLIARLPESCHTILISRTLPNLPYAEMVARNEIIAVGLDDLRMTDDEIQDMALTMLNAPISESQAKTLTALDGWPAGIALALQPRNDTIIDSLFGGSSGPEALFEALAQPMLNSQPPELRNFLLGSSTLPYLTPELCEKVLDLPNSMEWLGIAQGRNLFLTNLLGRLEYHNLFRSFLQRELRISNPDRFTNLHLKAAKWFEKIDEVEQAFDHFMAANRPKNAQRIAEKAAVAYFGQGKFKTMLNWSARLHDANVLAPNLSYECSIIHGDRYEYEQAETELKRARIGFNNIGKLQGVLKVKLQRAFIYMLRGKYYKSLKLANSVINYSESSLRGPALRIIGRSYFNLGNVETAINFLEEAVTIYREQGLVSSLSHLLQDLQLAYMRLGKLDKMGICLQEVVALRRKLHGKSALALALVSLGYYYHKRSNYQEAHSTFDEALQLVAGSSDRSSEAYLIASLGDLNRDLGLRTQAQSAYDKALQLVSSSDDPSLYCAILVSLSTLRRWEGRPHEAAVLAEDAFKVADAHSKAFEAAMSTAVLWLARAEVDDPRQALEHLKIAVDDLHSQKADFELLDVLGGCAYVAACCGDQKLTHEYSTMALRLATAVGTAQGLAAEVANNPKIETHVPQFSQSVEVTLEVQKLRQAQSKLNHKIDVSNTILPDHTFSVQVITFGQEKVERNGKTIPIAAWKAAAPRELFFFLLFDGPKMRADIELAFWPDSGPDQARGLFHTTLHSARQALGHSIITFEDEMYFINPNLPIDCDAHQFESWATQARLLPPQDVRADDLWQKAVAIYGGDFLQSLDADWVVARRESYKAAYLDTLVGLGHCARARNDLPAAIDWYSTALIVDQYQEHIYRNMIRCYATLGELGKLKTCYVNLKELLRNDLGVAPSPETTRLVQSLAGNP